MKNKKSPEQLPPRFDREAFFLGVGLGAAFIALGVFLAWGILTAPEGPSRSTGFTTAQRLARVLPQSFQEKIALVLAGLFVLFGVIALLLGLRVGLKYLAAKIRS
jgi:ABC-type antimicrobial peptide transport system permease subunit